MNVSRRSWRTRAFVSFPFPFRNAALNDSRVKDFQDREKQASKQAGALEARLTEMQARTIGGVAAKLRVALRIKGRDFTDLVCSTLADAERLAGRAA